MCSGPQMCQQLLWVTYILGVSRPYRLTLCLLSCLLWCQIGRVPKPSTSQHLPVTEEAQQMRCQ